MLLENNPRAAELYDRAMQEAWSAKNESGPRRPAEIALYVLPRQIPSASSNPAAPPPSLHKWTMRTCFNAQEEIYRASLDEVSQLREVHPN